MPQFHDMVAENDAELAAFGKKARALDIRLSFHPSQYVLLNTPNPDLTIKSIRDLRSQAEILDRMGAGPEAAAKLAADEEALDRGVAAEREADVDEGAQGLAEAA